MQEHQLDLEDWEREFIKLLKAWNDCCSIFVVGGWVRDKLMGKKPNDMDMVVDCDLPTFLSHTSISKQQISMQYHQRKTKIQFYFIRFTFI